MDQVPSPKISRPTPLFKILIITAGLFVLLSAAFYAGYALVPEGSIPVLGTGGCGKSYQDGWNAAQEKLEQSGILRPEPAEIFSLSGTITNISGNTISIKADPVVVNPLAEPAPESRKIVITPNTKIIKQSPRSPEELNAEQEKYRSEITNLEPDAAPPTPPSPFTEEELEITDLKVGDNISVTSEENIKSSSQFEAIEIRLTVAPERPAPPAPPQE